MNVREFVETNGKLVEERNGKALYNFDKWVHVKSKHIDEKFNSIVLEDDKIVLSDGLSPYLRFVEKSEWNTIEMRIC